uniref:Leucyl aminopeptidase n=1 Tax=Paulinella micropora TaxID=1928728 RepID=A0A385I118_9EUKA|nr:leucyl aminopeptidase [Paulinella micropora]AXY63621.1 leucyl aminopeptidase [Paulinella micropora]
MQILLSTETLSSWSGDTLVIGLFKDDNENDRQELHKRFGSVLADSSAILKFSGKRREIESLSCFQSIYKKIILIGLGQSTELSIQAIRDCISSISSKMIGDHGTFGIYLPIQKLDPLNAVVAIVQSLRLSLYSDQRFRSHNKPRLLPKTVEILGFPTSLATGVDLASSICSGVELARQLVATPANKLTPQTLADTAENIARDFGLELKILGRSECEALGMGSYLGVAQGAITAPKFIHLTYYPQGAVKRRLAIVGKGVTFDSGGYNLKVGTSQIEMMKYDMGGSAAVLGAARTIGELQPKDVEVHMIIAACENMISGSAIHPGDILVASNGKTIEVNNTDAEGRLTLADALVYACCLKPDAVVDIATLTGACVIALGDQIAGLWSTNDELASQLVDAGLEAGELLWRMPLHTPYKQGLRSTIADMKNTGARPGSSITAALFLKEFITNETDWAHLDIAGTIWSDRGRNQDPPGATGFGVRTLVNWICANSAV